MRQIDDELGRCCPRCYAMTPHDSWNCKTRRCKAVHGIRFSVHGAVCSHKCWYQKLAFIAKQQRNWRCGGIHDMMQEAWQISRLSPVCACGVKITTRSYMPRSFVPIWHGDACLHNFGNAMAKALVNTTLVALSHSTTAISCRDAFVYSKCSYDCIWATPPPLRRLHYYIVWRLASIEMHASFACLGIQPLTHCTYIPWMIPHVLHR